MSTMTRLRWTKESVRPFLAKGQWFGSLTPSMQENIVARSEIVHFKPHTSIYRIGDPVDGLYAAIDGDIRGYALDDDNERIFLRAFGPGAWFGDAHIIDGHPTRTLEASCTSHATALFLSTEAYAALTASDPEYYRAFVRLLSIHIRHVVRVVMEARSEAPKRTARALLRLSRAHGVETDGSVRLAMSLSQADLASLVGVSRQYMNELIARWEDEGFLRWNGKAQPILRTDRLKSVLGPLDNWIENTDDWV